MPSIDLYATRLTLIIKKTRQKEKDQCIIIICVYTRPGFKFICLFFFLASISVEMWSDSAVSFYLLIDKTSACVFLLAPQKIQRMGLEYTTRFPPKSVGAEQHSLLSSQQPVLWCRLHSWGSQVFWWIF
jgi:hypothetical protein